MKLIDAAQGVHFTISRMKSSGNVMHSHHFHSYFEIYYMIGGSCRYFIDNKPYDLTEGDIILIPEGVIHRTDYDGKEHERMLLECSSDFIPEKVRDRLRSIGHLYRNPKVSAELHELLIRLESEHRSPDEYLADLTRSMMHTFFYTLARNKSMAQSSDCSASITESVVNYIQKNYASDIKLSELARLNFVSQEHLSRTFKKDTGFGFSEFLTLVRLKQAEKLLKENAQISISDVAYSSGFNDSNYFSDRFKKTYGMPPLKYRKQYRRK